MTDKLSMDFSKLQKDYKKNDRLKKQVQINEVYHLIKKQILQLKWINQKLRLILKNLCSLVSTLKPEEEYLSRISSNQLYA